MSSAPLGMASSRVGQPAISPQGALQLGAAGLALEDGRRVAPDAHIYGQLRLRHVPMAGSSTSFQRHSNYTHHKVIWAFEFTIHLMHSGRNGSSDEERVFLIISQRFDDDTRRLQGSIDTPL
jgi:hypothetical protein